MNCCPLIASLDCTCIDLAIFFFQNILISPNRVSYRKKKLCLKHSEIIKKLVFLFNFCMTSNIIIKIVIGDVCRVS